MDGGEAGDARDHAQSCFGEAASQSGEGKHRLDGPDGVIEPKREEHSKEGTGKHEGTVQVGGAKVHAGEVDDQDDPVHEAGEPSPGALRVEIVVRSHSICSMRTGQEN